MFWRALYEFKCYNLQAMKVEIGLHSFLGPLADASIREWMHILQ